MSSPAPACLVLTAGLGTRLDPITRLVAKPAVPLGARTLIEHVIAWLERQSVRDLVLNLHHLPSTVTTIVGDGSHLGVRARYSWEQPVLGSAGGPRRALSLLSTDPFLVVNGDTLCDFDLAPMIDAHRQSGAAVTMAVVPNNDRARYNGIRAGSDRALLGFVPKGHAEETWHYVGVQIANKSVFTHLQDGVPAETVAGFYPDIAAKTPGVIRVWPVTTEFLDVGTPSDYLRAAMQVAGKGASSERPASGVDVERMTITWASATSRATSDLRECIVAGKVVMPDGISATRSVIVPASVVRAGDKADIIGDVAIFPTA